MNRFSTTTITASILLVCASLAHAQFDGGPRYDAHSVSVLADRVHSDLDHAYSAWRFSKDDRDRLNHAEKELREFVQKWEDHKFDKGPLDDAIGTIQGVLDHNRLRQQDRAAISDDITQLRRMREAYDRHEIEE
jgi:hypothetical protein